MAPPTNKKMIIKGQLEKNFLIVGQYSLLLEDFCCIAKAAEGDGGVGGTFDVTWNELDKNKF